MAGGGDEPARMAEFWGDVGVYDGTTLRRAGDTLEAEIQERTGAALKGLAASLREEMAGRWAHMTAVDIWENAALAADLTGEVAWGQAVRLEAKGRLLDAKCCREIARAMSCYSRVCLVLAGQEVTFVERRRRGPGRLR